MVRITKPNQLGKAIPQQFLYSYILQYSHVSRLRYIILKLAIDILIGVEYISIEYRKKLSFCAPVVIHTLIKKNSRIICLLVKE